MPLLVENIRPHISAVGALRADRIFDNLGPAFAPAAWRHMKSIASSARAGEHLMCSPCESGLSEQATSYAAGRPGRTRVPRFSKKRSARRCADRRYMGSDIFYQLGPLTRRGDLLACRCRRLGRLGPLRRRLHLRLRASLWRPSCALRRRCGRYRRRSSS